MYGAENGNQPAYTRRRPDDGDVQMLREECNEHLQDATRDSRQEINRYKAAAAKNLFHTASKEVNPQAVEEDVERHWRRVQKLKREQLPDFPVKQPCPRKRQMFVKADSEINEENAVDQKRPDQNENQPRVNIGRVV